MPSCSKAKNPRNVEITFTEADHKYKSIIDGKEIEYISGTTFIKKFFPEFDPTGEITKRCAKREGLTVEQIRMKWREKADRSCKFGTMIHESCEDTILGRPLRNTPTNDMERISMKNAISYASKLMERVDVVGVEKIVFDENLRIAGTIDLLVKSKTNRRIAICDWKTNERIDMVNRYKNFGLSPIRHIPAINFHEYALQLNLYEYILKSAGYYDKDEKMDKYLFHISEKGVKYYPLPDYTNEIIDMIQVFELRNH